MIDPELKAKLDEIEAKVDAAYHAAHRAQQYLFWTGVVTLALFILPLIGLALVLPSFMSTYTSTYPALLSNQPVPQQTQKQAAQTAQLLNSLGL